MRPLPRVHAVTDHQVLGLPDLGVRAAAIAAGGSAIALHVRDHAACARDLTEVTRRFLTLAGPPEASVFVNGHPDIAQGSGAQGIQLGSGDLRPGDARRVFLKGWIGRSVHDLVQAEQAVIDGADFLLAGGVYPSATHPGQPAQGVDFVRRCGALGIPVIAIGGVTPERAGEVRDAGAYGVAAITALWQAPDPAAATMAMLDHWLGD